MPDSPTPPPHPSDGSEPTAATGPSSPLVRSQAPSAPPPASLFQVAGAVFWSFFGVRKGNAMKRDAVSIRPHQVILVGVALAAVFVATLLLVVRAILRSAGA